jgi:3-phosphoshikimate 1-carboxyvinyltransferase
MKVLEQNILGNHLSLIKMSKFLSINKKIENFDKKINISGDKSLSIRWVLLASQAIGKSRAYNLLMSEDVLAAIESVKKLGIKVTINKNYCEVFGNGINGFKYTKNLTINAKNSGTLGRLILGLLIKSPKKLN